MESKGASEKRPKIGLVLSGGSGKTFFHVGALCFLIESGIKPSYIGAVSAGTIAAAKYLEGDPRKLEAAALVGFRNPPFYWNGSEIIRRPKTFKSLMNNSPLWKLIRELKIELILNSPAQFDIVTTNFLTGQEVVFSNRADNAFVVQDETTLMKAIASFNQDKRAIFINDPEMCIRAMMASMALPGIFKPVEIYGVPFIDGGMINPLPIRNAIDNDCDIILAVDVDPAEESISIDQYRQMNWLKIISRGYHFPVRRIGQIDMERTKRINNKVNAISAIYDSIIKIVGANFIEEVKKYFNNIFQHFNFDTNGKRVDLVSIRPNKLTLISSMSWSVQDIKEMIDEGRRAMKNGLIGAGLYK